MLRALLALVVFVRDTAAQLGQLLALPLSAPERLLWDRARVADFRGGDRRAFALIYEAYAGLLYARVLLPALRQPALAEDALADTFERAHGSLRSVSIADRSLFFWLARIARNRALDMHRRKQTERRSEDALQAHAAHALLPEPDPESALGLRDETELNVRRIDTALARLNPRYRRAVELRLLEEQPREICAQTLEVTVPTFDVLLLRALRALRRLMHGAGEP
jgi:RNA polymerase sigma-70 factor (ECF subfamily)